MACLVVMQKNCSCCKFHLVSVSVKSVTLAKLYCCSPVACSQQHGTLVHSLWWGFVFEPRPRSSNHRYHLARYSIFSTIRRRQFVSILIFVLISLGHVLFVQYFILSQESNSRLHPLHAQRNSHTGLLCSSSISRSLLYTTQSHPSHTPARCKIMPASLSLSFYCSIKWKIIDSVRVE